MEFKNKTIASVLAFRMVGDKEVLSILALDEGNDWFDLPTSSIEDGDDTLCAGLVQKIQCVVDTAKNKITLSPEQLLPVGSTVDNSVILHSFLCVLPQWPGRPSGTNWVNIVNGRVETGSLADTQVRVVNDALARMKEMLLSPTEVIPSISIEMKVKLWNELVTEEEKKVWKERLKAYGVHPPINTEGKFVYDYIHPNLTVDIVVLAVNENGELMIPLVQKVGTSMGAGAWSLPGGYVSYDHYIKAQWEPDKDFNFNNKNKAKYLKYVKGGKSVVEVAARDILEKKTGIHLDESARVYPLTTSVQDNPRHGVSDGAPIISRSFLTIISCYNEDLFSSDSHAQNPRWFKIHRRLFRSIDGKGALVIEERGDIDKKVAILMEGKEGKGKKGEKAYKLSYNSDWADVYFSGGRLMIDHSQGGPISRKQRGLKVNPEQEIFGHHGSVIVEALEELKRWTFTSTMLADFIVKNRDESAWRSEENAFSFDFLKKLRDAVKCFSPSIRQNIFDKEKIKIKKEAECTVDDKEKGRRWIDDLTGDVYYIFNNGFLWKDEFKSETYYLNVPLLERFIELGSVL